MIILNDRFEVGYIDGQVGTFSGLRDAILAARQLLSKPGLAIIDHYAMPGFTQVWAVVDGKLRSISRKD
jgi:hypothetical protein